MSSKFKDSKNGGPFTLFFLLLCIFQGSRATFLGLSLVNLMRPTVDPFLTSASEALTQVQHQPNSGPQVASLLRQNHGYDPASPLIQTIRASAAHHHHGGGWGPRSDSDSPSSSGHLNTILDSLIERAKVLDQIRRTKGGFLPGLGSLAESRAVQDYKSYPHPYHGGGRSPYYPFIQQHSGNQQPFSFYKHPLFQLVPLFVIYTKHKRPHPPYPPPPPHIHHHKPHPGHHGYHHPHASVRNPLLRFPEESRSILKFPKEEEDNLNIPVPLPGTTTPPSPPVPFFPRNVPPHLRKYIVYPLPPQEGHMTTTPTRDHGNLHFPEEPEETNNAMMYPLAEPEVIQNHEVRNPYPDPQSNNPNVKVEEKHYHYYHTYDYNDRDDLQDQNPSMRSPMPISSAVVDHYHHQEAGPEVREVEDSSDSNVNLVEEPPEENQEEELLHKNSRLSSRSRVSIRRRRDSNEEDEHINDNDKLIVVEGKKFEIPKFTPITINIP